MAEYKSPLNIYGLKCFNTPGLGEKVSDLYGISGVVSIPASSTIYETSGTTGFQSSDLTYPSSLEEEILTAFKNVEDALKAAGVAEPWQSIYKMTSFHVGDLGAHEKGLEAALEKYLGSNRPAWSGIQVAGLAGGARVELMVSAVGPAK